MRCFTSARSAARLNLHFFVAGQLHGVGEGRCSVADDLELGFVVEDADWADLGLGHLTEAADQRQDPFRIGLAAAADIHAEPDAIAFGFDEATFGARPGFRAFTRLAALRVAHARVVGEVFRFGQVSTEQADQRAGELFSRNRFGHLARELLIVFVDRGGQRGVLQQALAILRADLIGAGRAGPGGGDVGGLQHRFGTAALDVRHQQHGRALLAGAAGAARAVEQGGLVGR